MPRQKCLKITHMPRAGRPPVVTNLVNLRSGVSLGAGAHICATLPGSVIAAALSNIYCMDDALPTLIAHRGNAAEFPENTLEALQSAVDLGLRHVEIDVQLSADRVPFLLHDADFRRMSGRADSAFDLGWPEISRLPMNEPGRFGRTHAEIRPCSLTQLASALARWPGVTAFVEIKRASLRRFGQAVVLDRLMACLPEVLDRCVLISFDRPCLEELRGTASARIGWVLGSYDDAERAAAAALAPEFLFCDVDRLPPGDAHLWPGPWDWAIYEIRDALTARALRARGARFVETMTVRTLQTQYAASGGR
jgi:glycerophosphoryl diester phosphodiesterase